MYSAVEPDIDALAADFCAEAETIWRTERESDSLLNLAAALFLSLGYLGQGRDHGVLSYTSQATQMAIRMGLFGVDEHSHAKPSVDKLPTEAASAYLHTAWGSFNWIRFVVYLFPCSLRRLENGSLCAHGHYPPRPTRPVASYRSSTASRDYWALGVPRTCPYPAWRTSRPPLQPQALGLRPYQGQSPSPSPRPSRGTWGPCFPTCASSGASCMRSV